MKAPFSKPPHRPQTGRAGSAAPRPALPFLRDDVTNTTPRPALRDDVTGSVPLRLKRRRPRSEPPTPGGDSEVRGSAGAGREAGSRASAARRGGRTGRRAGPGAGRVRAALLGAALCECGASPPLGRGCWRRAGPSCVWGWGGPPGSARSALRSAPGAAGGGRPGLARQEAAGPPAASPAVPPGRPREEGKAEVGCRRLGLRFFRERRPAPMRVRGAARVWASL